MISNEDLFYLASCFFLLRILLVLHDIYDLLKKGGS
jgi:hypothetical protein